MVEEKDVLVPVRDGARMAVRVYRPEGSGPFPTPVANPLQSIAYRFRKGNRIRLENANGDSPVTDGLFFHFYRPDKIGADTIYHDAEHPSDLVLPILNIE